jgi:hypothetical protein
MNHKSQRSLCRPFKLAAVSLALCFVATTGASASLSSAASTKRVTTKRQTATQKKAPQKQVAPQQKAAPSVFPAVTVSELPSGKDFEFASLAGEKKPVLVWFWAPS